MTDRELLELAAKAAGLKNAIWDNDYNAISYTAENGLKNCPWNPLTDDGDALRLAIDLDILSAKFNSVLNEMINEELARNSRACATRRAIVRLAARIEKKARLWEQVK